MGKQLWERMERQRRELESLTRELSEERRKAEELRVSASMALMPSKGCHFGEMLSAMGTMPHNTAQAKTGQQDIASFTGHSSEEPAACALAAISRLPRVMPPVSEVPSQTAFVSSAK